MKLCDYITSRGQCQTEAIAGERFCAKHSAQATVTMVNQFRIACRALGDAPERHAQATQLKSINGEIVIMRSLVEQRLNMIQDDAELVSAMPVIKDCLVASAKLAEVAHTMDTKLGNLLSKAAIIALAQEIIVIIETALRDLVGTEVTTEVVDMSVENIGDAIIAAVAAKENPDTK
jgi:hypothetical protein